MRIKGSKIFEIKLARNFFIYTLISVIQKLIPFLLLPFFSRYLTEDQLGYYLVYQAIVLLAMPIMTLGVETSISINYYHLEFNKFGIYLTNSIGFAFFLSSIVLLIIFMFKDSISILLNFPSFWLLIALLSILPQFIYNVRQILFRYQNSIIKYGILAILMSVLSNGIGFILFFTTSLTWECFVLGFTIGYFLISIGCLFMLRKENFIILSYSLTYIKDAIKVGYPVGLHILGSWLSNSINRILLNTLVGVSATASYGIGATFGMIMTLFQDSINLAYTPFLYEKLRNFNESNRLLLFKVGVSIYAVTILGAIFISIVGYYGVGYVFGNTYISAKCFIIPLVVSSAINGFYKIHAAFIFYTKKTLMIARITLLCGLLNVILAYFMILGYGIYGAVYSAVFIQFVTYILVLMCANRLYNMHWLYWVNKWRSNYL